MFLFPERPKKNIVRHELSNTSGKMGVGSDDEGSVGGGGAGGRGRGAKRAGPGRPAGGGAGAAAAVKKRKTISAKFAVFDRVLMGIYNDEDVVQGYALATVKAIHITSEGCSYTLTLDKDNEDRDGVAEEWLFRSVEAV